jgi:hypothetical protein
MKPSLNPESSVTARHCKINSLMFFSSLKHGMTISAINILHQATLENPVAQPNEVYGS